jgi:hypothetical protein
MGSGKRKRGVGKGGGQPGPIYDNAWRLLFEGQPAAVAALVTGEPLESFVGARFLTADLPGVTVSADALIEVGGRRLHVELQLRAEASRFEPRLVSYWARLNAMDEVPFEQHVIVMNRDGGRLSGTYRRGRLQLEYFVHHLWDLPVEGFLAHETLFPLAVLARARSLAERGAVFQAVIEIAESAVGSGSDGGIVGYTAADAARTIEIAATFASIYLDGSIITSILERNHNMTVLLEEFPWSQYCKEQGRVEGLQEGKEEGRMEALLTVAQARHGELNERLMGALGSSPRELRELTDMILNASSQTELEHLLET